MPELPEVETMRRLIERELVGRTVEGIDLRLPKLMRGSPLPSLDPLIGRRLLGARRRAKVLIVDFDGDLSWLAHFKLSGQLAIEHAAGERFVAGHPVPDPSGGFPHKATHLIVRFAGGTTLFHSDIRQFGWLRLMPTSAVAATIAAFAFGPEAVGEEAVTLPDLTTRLAKRRIAIKQALLDQGVIAGLGNIYVDEALHHAERGSAGVDVAPVLLRDLAVAVDVGQGERREHDLDVLGLGGSQQPARREPRPWAPGIEVEGHLHGGRFYRRSAQRRRRTSTPSPSSHS